jgi:DNA-binding transcriptional LysR family regulator
LIVNDFLTMLGAALGGVGLAQVPEPIAVEDGGRMLAARRPSRKGLEATSCLH